jgi:hypothetical protein
MHRRLIPLGSVLLPLLAALAACSAGDGDGPASGADAAANDAGAGDTSPGDEKRDAGDASTSSRDAGDATTTSPDAADATPRDDASDASTFPDGEAHDTGTIDANDAGTPPTGTLLVPGAVDLRGITSDGYVVYIEGAAIKAMPLAGGGAVTLTGRTNRPVYADKDRPGVVLMKDGKGTHGVPPSIGVYAWTAANGLREIAPAGWAESARALSPDGSLVAYEAGDRLSSFAVGKTDGSSSVTLQSLDHYSGCPSASFTSNGTLLLSHCEAPQDGGGYSYILSAFVGPTFTQTLSVLGANEYQVDPSGRWLWPGNKLYEVKTGAVVFSDPAARGDGVFDASGEHLFYVRSDGSLTEVATAAPTPTVLLPSGCLEIYGLSPDGTEILCRTQGPNNSVAIVGVATGTAAPPWPIFTAGAAPYLQFTTDSREILFLSGSDLYVVPAKGGVARLMLLGAFRYPAPIPIRGSRFLALISGSDWAIYDAAGVAPTSTLASGSRLQRLEITADESAIAYTVDGTYAGLYVAPLP